MSNTNLKIDLRNVILEVDGSESFVRMVYEDFKQNLVHEESKGATVETTKSKKNIKPSTTSSVETPAPADVKVEGKRRRGRPKGSGKSNGTKPHSENITGEFTKAVKKGPKKKPRAGRPVNPEFDDELINVTLHLDHKGEVSAKGHHNEDKNFVIHKGSQANGEESIFIQEHYKKLRRSLIDSGVLVANGRSEHYKFSRDHEFKSSSEAATMVCGRSANGKLMWKNAAGETLKVLLS